MTTLDLHYLICALAVTVITYIGGFCVGLMYHHTFCQKRAAELSQRHEKAYAEITEVGDYGFDQ